MPIPSPKCQIYPVAGETAIKNIVDGTLFTGTGTPTLVDEGAEKAWSIVTGTLLEQAIPSKTINGSVVGAGAAIVIRFKTTADGSGADFMPLIGVKTTAGSITNDSVTITRNGSGSYRGRAQTGLAAIAGSKANNVIHTLVYKVSLDDPALDVGKIWWNTTGRVGSAPNAVSTGANFSALAVTKAFINCQNSSAFTLLDFAWFDVEPTDADCAAIADDYRAVMPAPSGGTAPTGTVTIGTITPNSTGAAVPFTYSAADQTGFEYRLNGGAAVTGTNSPQVISGLTPSTAYTIEIRAINASGAGAWSAPANFTTSAAGSPPAGTFTVGTITTTQTTASVPYTYSAADFDSIEYRIDGGTALTASASPQAVASLTAGTTYGIQFRAVNAFGNGAWSTSAPFTTASVPVGTITLTGLANNTATLWSGLSGISCTVMSEAATSIVVTKTGLTANAGGTVTFNDAAITAGTWYTVVIVSGTNRGIIRIQAT